MLAAKHIFIVLVQQLLVVLAVVMMGWIVMASVSEIEAQTPTILGQDVLERDLAEVQRSYRGQLEEYRVAQQQFVVAQQESVQLGTLSSLEAAVKATQKVMIIRDQVLLSYVKILELELRLADGLELSLKDKALLALEETTKSLNRHLDSTRASLDRPAIATRADDFLALEPLYTFSVEFSRELLLLAKLRNSYDTAAGVFNELADQELELTAIAQEERQRALEEVRLSLVDVDYLLDLTELEFEESLVRGRVRKNKSLDSIYVELIQLVNFLDELHIPTI